MDDLTQEQKDLFVKYKKKYDLKEIIGYSAADLKNLPAEKLFKKVEKFIVKCEEKEKKTTTMDILDDDTSDDEVFTKDGTTMENKLDANGKPFLLPRNTLYFKKRGM